VRGEADLLICLTSAAAASREVNKKVATATAMAMAMAMEFVAGAVWFCGGGGSCVWRVHDVNVLSRCVVTLISWEI